MTHHDDYWPCACVKRDRAGRLTHIKQHHRTVERCQRCGSTREQADRIGHAGKMCRCACCNHNEGSDCACACHATGDCAA
jgi:hypothetical protein